MPLNSMQDLMIHKLQDIYDAENQALQAYPQIAGAVSSQELKQALQTHQQETQGQVQRLEQIFQQLGAQPGGQTCNGMQGLIQESQKIIQEGGAPEVLDAAIIAAAQAMEHYEIAGYGTARTLAQQAGMTEAAQLLEQTLEEEKQTDALLTRLAEQNVNQKAQQAGQ
ncbi:MAG: ferritin-like domain-containing protein [Chloroflexi bacterium]|nr:MAG: ferritin-like domain-containing protein [Chloroflexota bacterium]